MSSLSLLLQESTQDCDVVTIEATVVTGFEYMAMEECIEKLGKSTKPAVERGRIYFNIPICNICGVCIFNCNSKLTIEIPNFTLVKVRLGFSDFV